MLLILNFITLLRFIIKFLYNIYILMFIYFLLQSFVINILYCEVLLLNLLLFNVRER